MNDDSVMKSIARYQKKMYLQRKESEVKYHMLEKVIQGIVFVVVALIIYYLAQFFVAALGLPYIIVTLIGVLLLLAFIIWLIKAFTVI